MELLDIVDKLHDGNEAKKRDKRSLTMMEFCREVVGVTSQYKNYSDKWEEYVRSIRISDYTLSDEEKSNLVEELGYVCKFVPYAGLLLRAAQEGTDLYCLIDDYNSRLFMDKGEESFYEYILILSKYGYTIGQAVDIHKSFAGTTGDAPVVILESLLESEVPVEKLMHLPLKRCIIEELNRAVHKSEWVDDYIPYIMTLSGAIDPIIKIYQMTGSLDNVPTTSTEDEIWSIFESVKR